MKAQIIGFAVTCLLLFAGCQSQTTSVPSDNTENIIVEDTYQESQSEIDKHFEEEATDELPAENIASVPVEDSPDLVETSVKSLDFEVLNYIHNFEDVDTGVFSGQFAKVFCNSALFFYENAVADNYIYAGSNGSEYDDMYGCDAVGLNLNHFVINMGESIAVDEFSQLIGIKLIMYNGVQAEAGYINWFGESLLERNNRKYAVYIYAPIDNPINNESIISSDSFIIFLDTNNFIYFNPLKSMERDSWIDNNPLVYTLLHCPFDGFPYETEGMEVNDYGDGRLYLTYTDPASGWLYNIVDIDPNGTSVSEHSYISSIKLSAGEIFPDMPDMITYTEMAERYANFPWSALENMLYWDKATADAYFAVLVKQNFTKFQEVDYLGVELILYDEGQSYVTKDTEVEIYRYLQYIW